MFFIEDSEFLKVYKGNVLSGKIAVKKNESNVRDLDIKI
jgi:hypothetical protein